MNSEFDSLLTLQHNQYSEALFHDDIPALVDSSYHLAVIYSLMGHQPLAARWSDEHIRVLRLKAPQPRKSGPVSEG